MSNEERHQKLEAAKKELEAITYDVESPDGLDISVDSAIEWIHDAMEQIQDN